MPDLRVQWETDAAALIGPIDRASREMDNLIGRQYLVIAQNRMLIQTYREMTQALRGAGRGMVPPMAPGGTASAAYYRAVAAQFRAQQQYYRLMGQQLRVGGGARQQPGFEQRLGTFFRSMRYGVGQAMPLLGRTLDVLGLGRLGGAAMGAATAVGLLAEAAIKGVGILNQLGDIRFQTGATGGDMGRALAVASGLGNPEMVDQIAAGAKRLASSLASDPFAMMFAGRAGVTNPLGNTPYGNINQMRDYLRMARFIAMNANEQEAIRAARATGMEEILPLRYLDPQDRLRRLNAAQMNLSDDAVREAARARATWGDIKLFGMQAMQGAGATALGHGYSMMPGETGFMGKPRPGFADPEAERAHRAIEANTEALNALSTTMRGFRGGGERGRGALPRGWGGPYAEMNALWSGEARSLGAFNQ